VIRRAWLSSIVVLLLVASVAAQPAPSALAPGAAELSQHVNALTGPGMDGRAAGSPGADQAARYIADRLAAYGVKPAGDAGSYLQSFVVSTGVAVAAGTALERLGPTKATVEVGREWTPHGGSLAAEAAGEVVFAGYGVVAADRGWDDYAVIDARDKIVLVLDGVPAHLAGLRTSRLEKLITARRHGARAVLIVADALPSLDATAAPVRLVSGSVTPAGADRLLQPSGKTTAELRAALAGSRAPLSFAAGVTARIAVALAKEDRHTANVVGILPGTDPTRASEAVVLGGHYDHLGRAGGVVHPGADDNASGSALVLGLARSFAAAGGAPRTLVFVLFGGEEEGLLGSSHYVRHPAVPMDRTIAMLNFDMVGRLRNRRLHVSGVESGVGLRAVVTGAVERDRLNVDLQDTPFDASDHTAFYGAGVPVLFFTTGVHDDYHTPRDTADKINGDGMADIAAVAVRVAERLAGEPRPAYVKLSPPPHDRRGRGAGGPSGAAFLGISADLRGESDGVRLGSVLSDTAAARAGLQNGDVIVRLGDVPINNFNDLRQTLDGRHPGDTVVVLYLRNGEDHVANATLGARP
jgi:hypothetical protein